MITLQQIKLAGFCMPLDVCSGSLGRKKGMHVTVPGYLDATCTYTVHIQQYHSMEVYIYK